jgi:alpha-glucosidase
MQWEPARYAGFSQVGPWLPLGKEFETSNVAVQREDKTSTYSLYRRLIALRRERISLRVGSYRSLAADGDVLLYVRQHGDERLLVALNLGQEPVGVAMGNAFLAGRLLLSSWLDRDDEPLQGGIDLRPSEGAIFELAPASVLPQEA